MKSWSSRSRKASRKAKKGGSIPGNASVAIQQDPLSPTILVSRNIADNLFEDRDIRITGGRRKARRMTRRRRTGKN